MTSMRLSYNERVREKFVLSSVEQTCHYIRNKGHQNNLNLISWILWSVVWGHLASKSEFIISGVIWRSGP